ncbi:MAG: nucleotidyltransferase family protein [Rhodobacteraceae bacterium]|nr:nucleotidyltransferase family protein [Paracoccaceae bacterium]
MSGTRPRPLRAIDLVLLAGGASSRMGPGRDKLLEPVAGAPLLRTLALRAGRARGLRHIVAVLRPGWAERVAALENLKLRILTSPRAEEGMGGSIAAGIAALSPGWNAVILLPADMPEIETTDIEALITAHDGDPHAILRGASDGAPGHPVLFGAGWGARLAALSGDGGARALVAEAGDRLRLVALPGRHALTDLDTPDDWAKWNATRGLPPAPRRPEH